MFPNSEEPPPAESPASLDDESKLAPATAGSDNLSLPRRTSASSTNDSPNSTTNSTSTTTSNTNSNNTPIASTSAGFAPLVPLSAGAAFSTSLPSGSTAGGAATNGSSTTIPDSKTTEASVTKKKKKNSRRKHRNSHLGCGTCKKRRIKCDETLPACLNCLKGKLNCAYLNLDTTARNALRMAQFNQSLRQDKLEGEDNQPSSTNNSPPTAAAVAAQAAAAQAAYHPLAMQQPAGPYPLMPPTSVIQSPYGSLVSLQPVLASDGTVVYAATSAPPLQQQAIQQQIHQMQSQQMQSQMQMQQAHVQAVQAQANAQFQAQVQAQVQAQAQAVQVAQVQAAQAAHAQAAQSQLASPPIANSMGMPPPTISIQPCAPSPSSSDRPVQVPSLTPITSSPSVATAPGSSISSASTGINKSVSGSTLAPDDNTLASPASTASSVSPLNANQSPLSIPINKSTYLKQEPDTVLPPLLSKTSNSTELRVPALNKDSRHHSSYTDLTSHEKLDLKPSASSVSLSTEDKSKVFASSTPTTQRGSPILKKSTNFSGDHISTFNTLSISDNDVKLPSIKSLTKDAKIASNDKVPSISKLLS